MLQRLPPMMRTQPEDMEEEEEGEEEIDGEELGGIIEESGESTRSQLSYKPMTPKAPPLPEGLGLHREIPMGEGEMEGKEDEEEVCEGQRPASRASRISETLSRGKPDDGEPETTGADGSMKEEEQAQDGEAQGGESQGQDGDGDKDEEQNTSRGNEPADDSGAGQGEGDRGSEPKETPADGNKPQSAQSGSNVIDFSKPAASETGGQGESDTSKGAGGEGDSEIKGVGNGTDVVHPSSRQGSAAASRVKSRNDDAGGGSRATDQRATEESKTDMSDAAMRPVSKSKDKDRGREEAPPSREKLKSQEKQKTPSVTNQEEKSADPASKPGSGQAESSTAAKPASRLSGLLTPKPGSKPGSRERGLASKPASREKPGSREKLSSREKVASRGSQKKGEGSLGGSDATAKPRSQAADPIIMKIEEEKAEGGENQEANEAVDSQGRGGEEAPAEEVKPEASGEERSGEAEMTLDVKAK